MVFSHHPFYLFLLCLFRAIVLCSSAWNINVRVLSNNLRSAIPSFIPLPFQYEQVTPSQININKENRAVDRFEPFNFRNNSNDVNEYSIPFGANITAKAETIDAILETFTYANISVNSPIVDLSDKIYGDFIGGPVIDVEVVDTAEGYDVKVDDIPKPKLTQRVYGVVKDIVTLKRFRKLIQGTFSASTPTIKEDMPLTNQAISNPSQSIGLISFVKRTFRREILNRIGQRKQRDSWANAVSRDIPESKFYVAERKTRIDLQSNRFVKATSEYISIEDGRKQSKFGRARFLVQTLIMNVVKRDNQSQDVLQSSELKVLNPRKTPTKDISFPTVSQRTPQVNAVSTQSTSQNFDLIDAARNIFSIIPDTVGNVRNAVGSRASVLVSEVSTAGNNFIDSFGDKTEDLEKNKQSESGMTTMLEWISDSVPINMIPEQASKAAGSSMDAISSTIRRFNQDMSGIDFDVPWKFPESIKNSIVRQVSSFNRETDSSNDGRRETIAAERPFQSINNNDNIEEIIPKEKSENLVSSIMDSDISLPSNNKIEMISPDMTTRDQTQESLSSRLLSMAWTTLRIVFPFTSSNINYISGRKGQSFKTVTKSSSSAAKGDISRSKSQSIPNEPEPSFIPVDDVVTEPIKTASNQSQSSGIIKNAVTAISSVFPWKKSPVIEDIPSIDNIQGVLENDALSNYDPLSKFNQGSIPLPLVVGDSISVIGSSIKDASLSALTRANKEDSASKITSIVDDQFGGVVINDVNFRMKSQVLRSKPVFIEEDRVPLPTKADFAHINARRVAVGVTAALAVKSEDDAREFMKEIGLKPILTAVLSPNRPEKRVEAIHGICRLMKFNISVAASVAEVPGFLGMLSDLMETPLRRFLNFKSPSDREKDIRAQYEAVALVKRMVRSSDASAAILRNDTRIKRALTAVIEEGLLTANGGKGDIENNGTMKTNMPIFNASSPAIKSSKKSPNIAKIVDLVDLKTHEMARVAAWGIGGLPWKPRQPGQKGLRILSFDGGGTRGVLSIALLKELMLRVGKSYPCDMFDIICGTSTGGIIAALLGIRRVKVDESETMYDSLIDKVFGSKSNLKLIVDQASYDEVEFENILYQLCQDELLLDSNQYECPRVFFVSTKVNVNPAEIQLWRNYNYPPGQESRYGGTYRVNTRMAVRATTAAPTFFTPVQFEGGLYCDGALVANNPTAIALQEAKALYPNTPVELVVSIGTGLNMKFNSNVQSMGWDLLVNQLIASSTDTEDVHSLLSNFLPPDKYFRLNPNMQGTMAIDERNKTQLNSLKQLAKQTWRDIDSGPDAKRYEQLIKTLKGAKK